MPPRRLPSNYYLVAVPLEPLLLAMKVICGKTAAYHRFPCKILRRTLLSLRATDTSCFPRSTSSASTVNSCQLRLPPRDQPPAHLQTVIFQDLSFWTANTLGLPPLPATQACVLVAIRVPHSPRFSQTDICWLFCPLCCSYLRF